MLLKTGWKLFYSLSGGIYWAVEGEPWTMPKVLALEMPTYCAGRQAHKPLIVARYVGPDVEVVSSMGVTQAGSNDFSLGDLGMASQLKYPSNIPSFVKPALFFSAQVTTPVCVPLTFIVCLP